jgi:hypothetical protein
VTDGGVQFDLFAWLICAGMIYILFTFGLKKP